MTRSRTEAWRGPVSGEERQNDPVGSWSQAGLSVEAVTGEARPSEGVCWSGGRGEPSVGGRAVVQTRWKVVYLYSYLALRASGTGGLRGVRVRANRVGRTGFFGRSRVKVGGGIDHM